MRVLFALGAAVGGFLLGPVLEMLIDRLPERDPGRRIPLTAPPRCATCGSALGWSALLPWRAPCAACGTGVQRRRFAVQVLSALGFGLIAWHVGPHTTAVPFLFLTAVMVVVTVIDIEHHRIPDRVVFPAFAVAGVLITAVSLWRGEPGWIVSALIGSVAFFAVLAVFNLVYPQGMGFGDVKFALLLGLFLGWVDPLLVLYGLLLASATGIVMAIPTVVRRGRRAEFPFGPALCLGTLLAIVFAESLLPT